METVRKCAKCGTGISSFAPEGLCPGCLLDDGLSANEHPTMRVEPLAQDGLAPAPSPTPDTARFFGDYELLETIAQGGMGIVYKARQVKLDRIVALKTLLLGAQASPEAVRRFQVEVLAAASLQHPNIVAIHEVGYRDGQHYFTMDFVNGPTLAALAQGKPLPAQRAARYLQAIAEAIQYAHGRGILHRDLKPSNVLIDQDDRPRVTDFGLAKRLESESGLTLSGQVVGTPSYLPPEQAGGQRHQVGPASDVYALGAILYYLLTGRPPFVGETLETTLGQVQNQQPISPRLLNGSVPRDLETICLKCLEKEPSRRYATAQALADELERFQRGEPIQARPIGPAGKVWRWCRRKPVVAGLAGGLVLALVLGLAGVTWQWQRAKRIATAEERQRLRAEANLYAADVNLASRSFDENNLGTALGLLEQHRPKRGEPDLRGWEWRYLWQQCQSDELFLLGRHSNAVAVVAFAPDGNSLASGSYDRTVRIWDLRARCLRATLPHDRSLSALAFSPDGKWLVTATAKDEPVRLWDTSTWRGAGELARGMSVVGLTFSPDGRTLAAAAVEGGVLWDINSRRQLSTFPASDGGRTAGQGVSFSPNGQLLAYRRWDGERTSIFLWNLAAGQEVPVTAGHSPGIEAVAFSPDGKCLASAGWDTTVRISDVARQVEIQALSNHTAWVSSLAFLPDGSALATAGADQCIRLWNTTDWHETAVLRGHRNEVLALACSPDGRWLASGDKEGTVRLWAAVPKARPPTLARLPMRGAGPCVAPSGEAIALIYEDGTIGFWKVAALAEQKRVPCLFPQPDTIVWGISAGGKLVAQALKDRTIRVWDSESRQETKRLGPLGEAIQLLAFSSDGDRLAAVGEGRLWVWELGTGREVTCRTNDLGPLSGSDTEVALAFAPDGRSLCTGHESGVACVWRLEGGGGRVVLRGHRGQVFSVAIAQSNNLVATTGDDGTLKLWDPRGGQTLATLRGQLLELLSAAFSPDSRRVAAGTTDGLIKLWDTTSYREVGTLRGPHGMVYVLSFLPDGATLAAKIGSDWLRVWRAPSLTEIEEAEKTTQREAQ
jgi:eukaryotic-like serine/threonine-protein kinase